MNNNSKELEYLNSFESAFRSSKVDLKLIELFVKEENRHKLHAKSQYSENYRRIFTILRDNIIIPNSVKLDFLILFEDISVFMKMSKIVLPPNPNTDKMTSALLNSLKNNEYVWQFRILRMVLALKTLNGEDFRDDFIKHMFFMPSASCFADGKDISRTAGLMRVYFGNVDCLLSYTEKHVYNGDFFNRSLMEQKASLMWILEVVWNVAFKEDAGHHRIIPVWIKLFKTAIERDNRELALYMHLPLSHIYLNLCSLQEEFKHFTDEVEMPLSDYIGRNAEKWGLSPRTERKPKGSKLKLAFITDRLVLNAPVKLLISLLTYIKDAPDLEIYLYDMGYIEKATSESALIQEVKDLGIIYVNNHDLIDDASLGHYYSHYNKVLKLREKIESDGIDAIVSISNRLHTNFLFATRSAPAQIFWDHGNHEYNVNGIDKRIRHYHDNYAYNYEYELFTLRLLRKYTLIDICWSIYKASLVKEAAPPHKSTAGVIGRLMKLSDRYIETVAEILRRNPDAIFYACGTGDMDRLKAKVGELGIEDRFLFKGWVDPHVYAFVFDVYLNTFPLPSGESLNEYMMKNLMKDHNKYDVSIKDPSSFTEKELDAYIQKACDCLRMSACREDAPKDDTVRVFMTEKFAEKFPTAAERITKSGVRVFTGQSEDIEKSFGANIIISDEHFRLKETYGNKFARIYYDGDTEARSFAGDMKAVFDKYGSVILASFGSKAVSETAAEMAEAVFDGCLPKETVQRLFNSKNTGGEYIADMVELMAKDSGLLVRLNRLKSTLIYLADPNKQPVNLPAATLRHIRRVLDNTYYTAS